MDQNVINISPATDEERHKLYEIETLIDGLLNNSELINDSVITFVAMTTFLEAEGQTIEEKVWVATTIYNRSKQPDLFPNMFPTGLMKDYSGWRRNDLDFGNALVQKAFIDSARAAVVAREIAKNHPDKLPITFYVTKASLISRHLLTLDGLLYKDKIAKDVFGIDHELILVPGPREFKHLYFRLGS